MAHETPNVTGSAGPISSWVAKHPYSTIGIGTVVVGILLVVVLGAVMSIGLGTRPRSTERPEDAQFPSLRDDPDPRIPGTVSFATSPTYPQNPDCIYLIAAAGGSAEQTSCPFPGDGHTVFLSWTKGGRIVATQTAQVPVGRHAATYEYFWELIDPETGRSIRSVPFPRETQILPNYPPRHWRIRADGSKVLVGAEGNTAWVAVESPKGIAHRVLEVEHDPESGYEFATAQWSPDGEWLLVSDNTGQVLIVGSDGTPRARVLVWRNSRGSLPLAWFIPGDETYTVEPPR